MSDHPEKFIFTLSCSFRGVRSVTFAGGRIRISEGEIGSKLKTREKLTPNSEAWRIFNGALHLLEIERWKERYDTSDLDIMVLDGGCWSLEIQTSVISVRSSGENAYPDFISCDTTLGFDRLVILAGAVDQLIGKRYFTDRFG